MSPAVERRAFVAAAGGAVGSVPCRLLESGLAASLARRAVLSRVATEDCR